MLYFSRWKAAAILLTALIICSFAVPNFFSTDFVKRMPLWAQRHVVLGADIQGASHVVLEVDAAAIRKERVGELLNDARRILRQTRIGYSGLQTRDDGVEFRVRENSDVPKDLVALPELSWA